MIAIVDYGVGNIFSLYHSFEAIGADVVLSSDEKVIRSAEKIVLPGVGAFADARQKLRETELDRLICEEAENGKPLLGICLGMQLLFERSFEYGEHSGLALIPGDVVPMRGAVPAEYKIPHIGWNALHFPSDQPKNKLFAEVCEGDYVYFVHSYYGTRCNDSVIAQTDYGIPICAAVAQDHIFGLQFHPEKSASVGLRILKAFCEL